MEGGNACTRAGKHVQARAGMPALGELRHPKLGKQERLRRGARAAAIARTAGDDWMLRVSADLGYVAARGHERQDDSLEAERALGDGAGAVVAQDSMRGHLQFIVSSARA